MEVLIFIALIVIFILVLNIQGSLKEFSSNSKKNFSTINNQLQELQNRLNIYVENPIIHKSDEEKVTKEKDAAKLKAEEEYRQKIAGLEQQREEREAQKKAETELQYKTKLTATINATTENEKQYSFTNEPTVVKESWSDKWIKNNPDLEKFIGENLFNKIGIAVLVFGIGFFVKYAIDQNWINEYGRVSIGLLCGIILIGFAHYLRNSYRSFSSVLAGGGITVFYFTIAFAFHQYHIIAQTSAFVIMVVITGFALALALLYDKIELAVIAGIGGFLTPFLVSTGEGNYIVLFTYLIILNIGLLALSYFKKWPIINILSLFFTILIYGSWMVKTFVTSSKTPPYSNALLFATSFYLIFLGMNMIYNISKQKTFKTFDFFNLILINSAFFASGIVILNQWHNGNYKGLFTICIGAINFLLAFYFFKKQKADKNLLYLLIGLTLTFLSLAAPIQLHGQNITLFWSAEAVLLYWLYQRSQIGLFKVSSMLVLILMFISLFMDWQLAGYDLPYDSLPIIFTGIKGIITNIIAVLSLLCYYFLLQRDEKSFLSGFTNKTVANTVVIAAIVLLYLTCFFGVNLYFSDQQNYILANVYHRILSSVFSLLLIILVLPKILSIRTVWVQLVPIFTCFLLYIGSGDLITILRSGTHLLDYKSIHLVMHWISDVCLLFLFYKSIQIIRNNFSKFKSVVALLGWSFSFMLVYFFSFEFLQLYVKIFANSTNTFVLVQQFERAGFTILWSICSFIMMWLGMKHTYKTLRVISLVLFAVTLFKLFLYDIRNIGPGGKIAAFILLGVLLLTVSFMYQRLKKILIDDTNK